MNWEKGQLLGLNGPIDTKSKQLHSKKKLFFNNWAGPGQVIGGLGLVLELSQSTRPVS